MVSSIHQCNDIIFCSNYLSGELQSTLTQSTISDFKQCVQTIDSTKLLKPHPRLKKRNIQMGLPKHMQPEFKLIYRKSDLDILRVNV